MFRKQLGTTPMRYLADGNGRGRLGDGDERVSVDQDVRLGGFQRELGVDAVHEEGLHSGEENQRNAFEHYHQQSGDSQR